MTTTITIDVDGEVLTHVANTAGGTDYATVCGQALDGDQHSGREVLTTKQMKVTCGMCYSLWVSLRGFRESHFSPP